ncbi:hypothetical protein M5K25_008947 [Dendrobium thyrsiflorum]|uniref:Uncharacterized protein n=1 Tax=Dendrobium thyrsiflorum TaxID=117978 RepID=A0ABD0VA18_DENTH
MVAKVSCGTCLSLSGSIITAGVANKNKSGGGELIFFKASVALALISFFTGLALLISVLLSKNVKRTILLGQIIVAVYSVLAGVVVHAISVFV